MIVVVGDANADLSAALARFPHEGDDSAIRDLTWGSGGTAANAATALARMGVPARLLARVGQDPAADVALQAARDAGVDLAFVQADPTLPTGLCFAAISPGGERTFFSYRGANVALAPPPLDALLDGAAWLHLGGHALLEGPQRETSLALLAEATRRGIATSLDLCLPLLRAHPALVLSLAPSLRVLFANEHELTALCTSGALSGADPRAADPALAAIAALGRVGSLCVVGKLGARGAVIGGHPPLFIPALPVLACDTTACGDAFVAAFLAAHLGGAEMGLCARLGNALGALVASRPGAAAALPTRDELHQFLSARDEHAVLALLPLLPPARRQAP
jgi:sugar/nucleoside kinase (ribokinase family)